MYGRGRTDATSRCFMNGEMKVRMTDRTCAHTRLQVPACSEYARIVRMLAAHTAVMRDFDIEAVEELRLAAEEAFVIACASDIAGTKVVDIDIDLLDHGIQLTYALGAPKPVARDVEHEMILTFAQIIMEDAVDTVEVISGDHDTYQLRLTKCVASLSDKEKAGE